VRAAVCGQRTNVNDSTIGLMCRALRVKVCARDFPFPGGFDGGVSSPAGRSAAASGCRPVWRDNMPYAALLRRDSDVTPASALHAV